MIALLLRLYPSRWRDRYGDEFAAILESRPLGPFDVADILLGALDAHLHLRGLGAASEHRKGFTMSVRVGGYAAIVGGLLWLVVLVGNAINNGGEAAPLLGYAVVAATVATLVALIGLSAFQARRHPVLTWAAFAIPAVGAVIGLLGFAATVVLGDTDATLVGGLSVWAVSSIGILTLLAGSVLFAIATWLARTLSRPAAVALAVGALLVVPAIAGLAGGLVPEAIGLVVLAVAVIAFPAGWVGLGVSALRATRAAPAGVQGAPS
jgi:hypothetical protein